MARNGLNQPQMWLCLVLSSVLCLIPLMGYNFLKPILWPINVDKVSGRREPPQVDLTTPFALASMSENHVPHALDIGSEQDPFLLEASVATPSPDQSKTPRPSTFCLCVLP